MGCRSSGRSRLSVAEVHEPAEAEQRYHEKGERVHAVVQAIAVRALGHHAQHHGGEQREQEGRLKMREIHFGHQSFLPEAISNVSTIASTFNSPAVTRNLVP